jgi:hypothetical protein
MARLDRHVTGAGAAAGGTVRHDRRVPAMPAMMRAMKSEGLEARRRAFNAMLDDAVAEADRDGWISCEEVMAELDAIIDEAEKRATSRLRGGAPT